jgi:hypothetical protein
VHSQTPPSASSVRRACGMPLECRNAVANSGSTDRAEGDALLWMNAALSTFVCSAQPFSSNIRAGLNTSIRAEAAGPPFRPAGIVVVKGRMRRHVLLVGRCRAGVAESAPPGRKQPIQAGRGCLAGSEDVQPLTPDCDVMTPVPAECAASKGWERKARAGTGE